MAKKTATSGSKASTNGKSSMAQQARDYLAEHPRATVNEIAQALGFSYQTVYVALGKAKKGKSKSAKGKAKSGAVAGRKAVAASGGGAKAEGLDRGIQALQLARQLLIVAGSPKIAVQAIEAAKQFAG